MIYMPVIMLEGINVVFYFISFINGNHIFGYGNMSLVVPIKMH